MAVIATLLHRLTSNKLAIILCSSTAQLDMHEYGSWCNTAHNLLPQSDGTEQFKTYKACTSSYEWQVLLSSVSAKRMVISARRQQATFILFFGGAHIGFQNIFGKNTPVLKIHFVAFLVIAASHRVCGQAVSCRRFAASYHWNGGLVPR